MNYVPWNGPEEEAGYIIQHRGMEVLRLADDYARLGNTKAEENCIVIASILNAIGKSLVAGEINFYDKEEGESK